MTVREFFETKRGVEDFVVHISDINSGEEFSTNALYVAYELSESNKWGNAVIEHWELVGNTYEIGVIS